MKRLAALLGAAFIAQMLIAGVVSAEYKPQNDLIINVNTPVNVPTLDTGAFTFNTQESVHDSLYQTSGASVDHYYIWIYVNGKPVAAIDPAKFVY